MANLQHKRLFSNTQYVLYIAFVMTHELSWAAYSVKNIDSLSSILQKLDTDVSYTIPTFFPYWTFAYVHSIDICIQL